MYRFPLIGQLRDFLFLFHCMLLEILFIVDYISILSVSSLCQPIILSYCEANNATQHNGDMRPSHYSICNVDSRYLVILLIFFICNIKQSKPYDTKP